MARHAQPREVAALKGADRKNPQRYRNEPPKADFDLGQPPAHLSPEAVAVWHELAVYAPRGVLQGPDRAMLELAANLFAEYRKDPAEFAVGKYTHLIGILARLGMSPADRQKLGAAKPPEENPFDGFN
jgi:phage terminase small subunit